MKIVHDADYYGRVGAKRSKNLTLVSNPLGKDLGEVFDLNQDNKDIREYIKLLVKTME